MFFSRSNVLFVTSNPDSEGPLAFPTAFAKAHTDILERAEAAHSREEQRQEQIARSLSLTREECRFRGLGLLAGDGMQ